MRNRIRPLSAFVNTARLRRRVSPTDLSVRLGFTTADLVRAWTRNKTTPSALMCRRIAAALDCELAELFGLSQPEGVSP